LIDRFRNRLMIPLSDQHGNVVGFTGRTMGDDQPKYMNSPETPIYHKGSLLYGLDLAKSSIKKEGRVIIVEGNLDVIASHKAGIENVVASSGTALTEDQLTLVSRYTKTIVFSFDQDAAGLKAARKGIAIARSLGYDVRAAILPEKIKDPDELVQSDPSLWMHVANESVPIMQFLIERVRRGKDMTNVDDKRSVSSELLPALSEIQDVIEREHWLQVIADLLSVDSSVLRASLQIVQTAPQSPNTSVVQTKKPERLSKEDTAFLILLGKFVNNPVVQPDYWQKLSEELTADEPSKRLYRFVVSTYDPTVNPAQKSFFERLRSVLESDPSQEDLLHLLDKSSLLAEQTFEQLSPSLVQEQVTSLYNLLQARHSSLRKSLLAAKLRQAESAGDHEAVQQLMRELNESSLS
jgi:DNA primase